MPCRYPLLSFVPTLIMLSACGGGSTGTTIDQGFGVSVGYARIESPLEIHRPDTPIHYSEFFLAIVLDLDDSGDFSLGDLSITLFSGSKQPGDTPETKALSELNTDVVHWNSQDTGGSLVGLVVGEMDVRIDGNRIVFSSPPELQSFFSGVTRHTQVSVRTSSYREGIWSGDYLVEPVSAELTPFTFSQVQSNAFISDPRGDYYGENSVNTDIVFVAIQPPLKF